MKLSIKQINSIKRITLLLVLATMLPAVASAKDYDFEVDGICYNKAADDPAKVIVTYNKKPKDNSPTYKKLIGDIIIPEVVNHKGNTYSVKEIGESAFMYCTDMNSVTIPSSVTKIGRDAFKGCSGLTAVNINDIAAWCNIDFDIDINQDEPFKANPLSYAKKLYLNGNRVTEIVIPSTVHSIKNYVFFKCLGLTSVTIPNSVESIGEGAFAGCEDLTSVIIPNSVKNIGNMAFLLCSSLTSVVIPNSVTEIGYGVFSGCSELKELTIPNSVTSIGELAFNDCNNLEKVHCGITSPAVFGDQHFNNNTYVYVPAESFDLYKSTWNSSKIVEEGAFIIPDTTFEQNGLKYKVNEDGKTLTVNKNSNVIDDLIIRETITYDGVTCKVTSIGSFENCAGLTSVTIPNSVTKINSNTFKGCTRLASVTIGNSVTEIGSSAFSGCTGLNSVIIPNSVTKIGSSAFFGCTGLTSVTIPNSVTEIGFSAFSGCTGLTSVNIPNSVTTIDMGAFEGCAGLTSITIPNSVTRINSKTFKDCTGLTSVTIGNSVTFIDYISFKDCTSLTSLTLGNSLKHIHMSAFEGCKKLETVTILGNSLESVDYSAFDNHKLVLIYTEKPNWWNNGVSSNNWGNVHFPSGSGRKPTAQEINSVGRSNFNKLNNGDITRGMTKKTIDLYDALWDSGPLYDCLRIDVYRRQWTRDNISVYTIGFEGFRDYYITFSNGVITSVAY